jgi:hypothetical protein
MFDLEKAIKQWCRELRKNEAIEDGYLAEIESHLRDEFEHHSKKGIPEEEAFQKSLEEIGHIDSIGAEYFKTDTCQISGRPPWNPSRWMPVLVLNYLKIALRRIRRHKGHSFINIAGLAVGMAACILMLIWVQDELRYDRFHKNADQIYRINIEDTSGGKTFLLAGSPAPLGQAMVDELPEVLNFSRVQAGWPRWNLSLGENRFQEEFLAAVDPTFFEIFSFPFISGNPKTALEDRYSIVL